jgi:hypothetical protein
MAQAVSRRPLRFKARAECQASPCGICGEKVAMEQGFLRVLRFSPVISILRVLLAHYSSTNDALQSQQLTAAL